MSKTASVETPEYERLAALADRVARHMETEFPTPDVIGWAVARDQRDGTAVVAARPVPDSVVDPLPGVRGITVERWLWSLRGAGFVAQPRTDMEVFGRPGEESPDGYAHWLHVTGWQPPAAARPESAPAPAGRCHHIALDPATAPRLHAGYGRGVEPLIGLRVLYRPDGSVAGYVADWEGVALRVFTREVPGWARALADEHRECVGDWPGCWQVGGAR